MNVIPFVHEGLGNSSYLVDLDGREALLVDPDRGVDRYLVAARDRGLRVAAVLETHLHADFVSGAHEAGHRTDARVFVPAGAEARFPHQPVSPDEALEVDGVRIEPVRSPGHTPEHLSYVVRAGRGVPLLFSGGSLIVGGAARTDLIAPSMTESLTRQQFRTLREAFAELPDETALHPTHGGGSFCSTGVGGERTSTLGRERAENPLLAIEDEEEFVRWFPSTFPAAPSYFFRLRAVNQAGPRLRAEITPPPALDPGAFDAARHEAIVVDARPVEQYARGHVPGALSNEFRDAFATWLGWLVPLESPLLFVTGDIPLERIVEEAMLVGFERFAGYLAGGMAAWERAGLEVKQAEVLGQEAARRSLREGAVGLDVRERDEWAAGHIEGAVHLPLGELPQRLARLDRERPYVVYCGAGMRATTALSLLERAGIEDTRVLEGGTEAWAGAGLELVRG